MSAEPTPANTGLAVPSARPLAADGAALFAEHCAACHGEAGKGDGEKSAQLMSQSQRTAPLPDFSLPDLARATTPAAWFQVITEGRMDQFMPPWADTLTDAERWSLVAFLYTLSTPQKQIDTGKAVYEANCARCHGEGGKGDGPAASGQKLPDLTDLAYMSQHSQTDLFNTVTKGTSAGGDAFETTLSEADRWAVVDYVRAFSYEYLAPGSPLPEKLGTVSGQVVNGTGGAAVPAGLEMTLHGFANSGQAATLTTTVDASGVYKFEYVPYRADRQFIVSATYQEVIYGSEVAAFSGGQTALDLPLTVYETTTDPAAIRVERMHVFFEFAAGKATVGELYILTNNGDKTLWKRDGSVEFALPPNAAGLSVQGAQEGVDFVRTAQGFAATQPIRPGQGSAQILLSFSLPYEKKLDFEQKMLYPVDSLNVLVPDLGVKLQSALLTDQGPQNIQGTVFQNYSAASVPAGQTLAFQLSGEAAAGTTTGLAAGADPKAIAVGLGALAVVLLGVGYWWYQRRSPGDETGDGEPASREDLLQEIADLDDAFEAGEIGERDYKRERAKLKTELMKMWTR